MKLKKLAVLMSCTTLAIAVSSCSANKVNEDTAKVQELNTAIQATTDTQQATYTYSSNDSNAKTAEATPTDTEKAPTTQAQAEVTKTKLTIGTDARYTVGYQVGHGIASQNFDLDNDQITAGFQDAIEGKDARLSQDKIDRNMNSLKDKMIKKQLDVAKDNKVKSAKFMAEVAKMDNAIKVNDQAFYQVVKQGEGKKPNADSTLTIAYKGTTPVTAYDADKFKLDDVKEAKLIGNSFDSNDNATFSLGNLIQCWKDAIPEIPVGSTVILYCAPEAAYGTRAPASIGPNQALSFKITVKDFK